MYKCRNVEKTLLMKTVILVKVNNLISDITDLIEWNFPLPFTEV